MRTKEKQKTSESIIDTLEPNLKPIERPVIDSMTSDTLIDYNYYKNRIQTVLESYEIENNCSLKDIKKTEWNAVLILIYQNVFKLSKSENIQKYKYKPYNDNELMLMLCDLYIYLCYLYNKPVNITGFNHMLNLSDQYLYRYDNKESYIYIDIDRNNHYIKNSELQSYRLIYPNNTIVRMLNHTLSTIKQKLVYNSERSLQDMALDGSVMALAIGKIVHGWEEGKRAQIQAESMEKYVLPSDLIEKYSHSE